MSCRAYQRLSIVRPRPLSAVMLFVATLAIARGAPAGAGRAEYEEPRFNLVFILTDQQSRDTMGAYGNDRIRTPNLDALARRSVLFERAYVTQPLCTPSRATILTGLYPHTHGAATNNRMLPQDRPILTRMLPPGTYRTAWFGKWHLGDEDQLPHVRALLEKIHDWQRRHADPLRRGGMAPTERAAPPQRAVMARTEPCARSKDS